MDTQHRLLLKLCHDAAALLATGNEASNQIHVVLNALCLYAKVHFTAEEELLAASGYPDLAAQRAEHDQYWGALTRHLEAACAGTPDREALYRFLTEWWRHHILVSDMEYKAWLAEFTAASAGSH